MKKSTHLTTGLAAMASVLTLGGPVQARTVPAASPFTVAAMSACLKGATLQGGNYVGQKRGLFCMTHYGALSLENHSRADLCHAVKKDNDGRVARFSDEKEQMEIEVRSDRVIATFGNYCVRVDPSLKQGAHVNGSPWTLKDMPAPMRSVVQVAQAMQAKLKRAGWVPNKL